MTEVKKRISEMDVQAFGDKAKRYVEEKNFSDKANEELRLYNLKMKVSRLELLQYEMAVNMVAMADEEYKLADKFLNQEYVETLKSQAGILGMSVGSSQAIKAQMDGVINTPFKNVTWSERIWSRQEALRGIVQKATADLVLRGKNPTLAIPQLRKEFDVSVYEAKRLAVTEGARVQMAVQKASFEQMGFEEYEYISEPGACAICRPLDGKHFKVADMQSGLNASPMHPFCRCSTAAHYTEKKSVGTYEEMLRETFSVWEKIVSGSLSKNEIQRRLSREKYYVGTLPKKISTMANATKVFIDDSSLAASLDRHAGQYKQEEFELMRDTITNPETVLDNSDRIEGSFLLYGAIPNKDRVKMEAVAIPNHGMMLIHFSKVGVRQEKKNRKTKKILYEKREK